MPRYNKEQDFKTGLAQLEPFFDSLGFSMSRLKPSRDKEGTFYSARFVRRPRSVQFTHLYSLGPVLCIIGMLHRKLANGVDVSAAAQFPSFADDSISGYRALLHDLQTVITPFFTGTENDFIAIASRCMEKQRQQDARDTRELSYHSTQEPRLKARARELFLQGRYEKVIRLESEIRFSEFLTSSERRIFALARKRRNSGR
jgi:hypothetical protein